MRISRHSSLLAACAFLLAACATPGPNVSSSADPETNFAEIKTFGIMKPLGTDRPGGIRTPLSNMLVAATVRELEARGWQQSSFPEVLVNFFVNAEERMDVRQVPTGSMSARGGFYSYRHGRYRGWPSYQTRVRQYTQGTLVIDVIDPGRSMLVWEGVAQGRLSRGNTEFTQERVNGVVSAVLAELPR